MRERERELGEWGEIEKRGERRRRYMQRRKRERERDLKNDQVQ